MVDGAHNPHSAGRIVEAVKEVFPERRVVLIVGVSGNKDLPGLVEELARLDARAVIATRSRHPRAAAPERIAQTFAAYTDRSSRGRRRGDGPGNGIRRRTGGRPDFDHGFPVRGGGGERGHQGD